MPMMTVNEPLSDSHRGSINPIIISGNIALSFNHGGYNSSTFQLLVVDGKGYIIGNNSVSVTGYAGGSGYACNGDATITITSIETPNITTLTVTCQIGVSGTMDGGGTSYTTVVFTVNTSSMTLTYSGNTSVSRSGLYGFESLTLQWTSEISGFSVAKANSCV